MDEKKGSFNVISETISDKDIIGIIHRGIVSFCGVYPDNHEEYFEIRTTGRKDAIQLENRLRSIPGIGNALEVKRSKKYEGDRIFRINKAEYVKGFRLQFLHGSMSFNDRESSDRLGELASLTTREWYQTHSPLYATEVVQLVNTPQEPAERDQQVWEMSHQLRGDTTSAVEETRDWLSHLMKSETAVPNANHKTAVPSDWASRENIAEMSNRVNFNEKEKDRVRSVFKIV